jgi:short-subunit dehydrogenase
MELTDTAALLSWVQGIAPRIDLAIVNAGITSDVRTGESWPEVERLLQVNVFAAFATVGAVLPAMRGRGRGQIALVSSVAAWFGMPLTPAYSASKAALKAYGEALRGWLAPEGVQVNVVMPGFVKSAMSDRFPGPKRFMLEPQAAARLMVAGLERNEARISFPLAPSLFMWALGAMPAALAQRLIAALGYGR